MKRAIRNIGLVLLCALPMTSCGTSHLIRWAQDEPSIYNEPESDLSRGLWKGFVTVVGFPVAVIWDVFTFPFQIIGGAHPYGESTFQPEDDIDI